VSFRDLAFSAERADRGVRRGRGRPPHIRRHSRHAWAGVLFFGCAALTAIRLAVADAIFRQDTPPSIRNAIAIQWPTPAAEFEQALAEMDPAHAREFLERATRINPRSSAAWIALGLLEETSGNPAAERSLLEAAQVDHQYLPAWTLANFYFRHANREQFWGWAQRAASLHCDDLQPLLRLSDQFEPDPAKMLAYFHDARRLRPAYLNFLIGENRLDAAQQVAREMSGERANDPYLIGLADRQLRTGKASAAMELWNVASGFPAIGPSAGRILTNGDLARAPLNLGFDWRMGQVEGVAQSWRPSELVFTFSGSQSEACVLLEQTIYLVPGKFRLRFKYLTGEPSPMGVHWSLDDMEGPRIEPSAQWREGAFDLPSLHGIRNLKLFYRREAGTTRTEGRIEVRDLRLEAGS
jgi:tetratricopeptide (TPR) repeat protein